jgi:uncharacterized peroxidase-related enzyme
MARIQLQNENCEDAEIRPIFDEIIERVGKVPAAYRAFGRHSHILQANWNRTKNILGKGNLSIELKEAIAYRVSTENGCTFCMTIHKQNLEKLGQTDERILNIEKCEVVDDEKLQLVLRFVSIATKTPAELTDDDFDQLKQNGFSEEDILEMLTVMEMYTGYNKIIVALGLKIED